MYLSLFSLDRFFTLYFFRPVNKILPRQRGIRIPILMYHSISGEPESGHPYYWINTSPQCFAKHMQFLHDNHYAVISLADAAKMISSGASEPLTHVSSGLTNLPSFQYSSIPQKNVVLTFDDGYSDFCDWALPELQKYGFSATVFLATGFVGENPKLFKGKECLTWIEIQELAHNGIEFGSHTVRHRRLIEMNREELRYEITVSKEAIEAKVAMPVEAFSYPFAFPDGHFEHISAIRKILQDNGFKCGVTTRIGRAAPADDALFLKRLPISEYDDIRLFKAKLGGAYDWLFWPQLLYKRALGSRSRGVRDCRA